MDTLLGMRMSDSYMSSRPPEFPYWETRSYFCTDHESLRRTLPSKTWVNYFAHWRLQFTKYKLEIRNGRHGTIWRQTRCSESLLIRWSIPLLLKIFRNCIFVKSKRAHATSPKKSIYHHIRERRLYPIFYGNKLETLSEENCRVSLTTPAFGTVSTNTSYRKGNLN